MTTTARSTLLRQLAQEMFPERYVEFTALAASTTTDLQANELRHADASANALDPGWVYVYAGASLGDERNITTYEPRAALTYGSVVPHRPFTSDIDGTSVGFVYTGGLAPSQLLAHINSSLRRSRQQRTLPLTLVADGLMEESGTTSWTASSTTLTKTTTTATVGEGLQGLQAANSGASGEAQSTAVPVVPGERLHMEATVRLSNTSGTHVASLIAYDVTNAAAVLTKTTSSRARVRLGGEFTVPAGCFSLRLNLRGSAADTTALWDEVLLWREGSGLLRLPSTVTKFDQVLDVFQRVPGEVVSGETGHFADDYKMMRVSGWEVRADPSSADQFTLDLARSNWTRGYPIVTECLLPWGELASDTATTAADRDEVILRAKALAYAQLARIGPGENRKFYKAEADLLARTWATAASRQPRPAVPIKAPRSSGQGNSTRRWWR